MLPPRKTAVARPVEVTYDGKEFLSNRKNVVKDSYFTSSSWLPPRKARLCRVAGALFLLAAAIMPGVIAFAGLTPGASPVCGGGYGCMWNMRPTTLLPEETRMGIELSPAARRTFEAYAMRPDVRLGLAAVDAITSLPFAVLLLSVGLALRRLGGRGADTLAQALPWLRRASMAAMVWTLLGPVYESVLETLLSPGTPDGLSFITTFYLADIAGGLLLAFAAYAAIWAVEAGLKAQRDLDDFV